MTIRCNKGIWTSLNIGSIPVQENISSTIILSVDVSGVELPPKLEELPPKLEKAYTNHLIQKVVLPGRLFFFLPKSIFFYIFCCYTDLSHNFVLNLNIRISNGTAERS